MYSVSPGTQTHKQGFTLIELLTVVSIIALLTSIIVPSISEARAKSRDAVRVSNLRTIQNALELYAADNAGRYPPSQSWSCGSDTPSLAYLESYIGQYLPINEVPNDPQPFCPSPSDWGRNYIYYRSNDGLDYKLIAHGAPEIRPTSIPQSLWDPRRDGGWPTPPDCTSADAVPENVWALAVWSSGDLRCF